MQKIRNLLFSFFIFVFSSAQTNNQNITLSETDRLLIKNNLELLVAKYNVNVAEAQRIQAKLFNNPELAVEVPAYSKEKGWFNVRGDIDVSIQEAIQIAGKRKAGIKLAESQKELAGWQYELLAQQMKYVVHNSFFTIYYLQKSIDKTGIEISKIRNIIDALKTQYNKGNVTLNELIRVTATYNSLSNSMLDLTNSINEEKNNLSVLLLLDPALDFTPAPTPAELDKYSLDLLSLPYVIEKAEEQHPQIKLAEAGINMSERQLKYEKKQVVPDLQLGVGYSKEGGYVPNLTYASVGLSIPIFNRNQGNIKAMEYQLKQAQLDKNIQENILKNNIILAYTKIQSIQENNDKIAPDFESQFDELMTSVSDNYMKRNISLLEFTDLIETYQDQIVQLNNLRLQRIMAYEDLDYNTGYTLFK
jgi:cobalt-zinc-cadmium efflux system outer membrane protein